MSKEQYLEYYCMNNAMELNRIVNKILYKHRNSCIYLRICQKDLDDFYSIAGEVLWEVCKAYDEKQDFGGFLYACLEKKIKTEITRRNREKRKGDRESIPIDTVIGEDETYTIGDCIVSDFEIEREVFKEEEDIQDLRIQRYLEGLSINQRRIVNLLVSGYKSSEIQRELHMSSKTYMDCMKAIQSYENIKILL